MHRLGRDAPEFALDDVVGNDALEVLVALYLEIGGGLRHTLAALQTAADHAVNAGSERIRAPHVQAAGQERRVAAERLTGGRRRPPESAL